MKNKYSLCVCTLDLEGLNDVIAHGYAMVFLCSHMAHPEADSILQLLHLSKTHRFVLSQSRASVTAWNVISYLIRSVSYFNKPTYSKAVHVLLYILLQLYLTDVNLQKLCVCACARACVRFTKHPFSMKIFEYSPQLNSHSYPRSIWSYFSHEP